MIEPPLPPVRSTEEWPARGGVWTYDTWGRHGRPVLLIPAVLFDRVTWWPAAADLRPHATVVAADLPGHGGSDPRLRYEPDELVDDLAGLIAALDVPLAPIVVGHGSSAGLATLFATRYAVHALVTVDADDSFALDRDRYLQTMNLDALPAPYRNLVDVADEPRLLRDYAACIRIRPHPDPPSTARHARLAIRSRPPADPDPGDCRMNIYDVPGRFAHLIDVDRFVCDIKRLL